MSGQCGDTIFRYKDRGEKKIENLKVCKEKNNYVSKSCLKNKCKLIKKIRKQKLKFLPVGSPHFSACHKIGATPIIGELKIYNKGKKKWFNTAICFDKRKKDFINSAKIIKLLKRK